MVDLEELAKGGSVEASLLKNKIRFQTIGRVQELEPSVQRELERAIRKTRDNTGMILNVALNYGGRAELVDTFNRFMPSSTTTGTGPRSAKRRFRGFSTHR